MMPTPFQSRYPNLAAALTTMRSSADVPRDQGAQEARKRGQGHKKGVRLTPSVPNQTEFTLLSYLFTQASIDSTKLPVSQFIQVR